MIYISENILVDEIPYEEETYFKYTISGQNFYVTNKKLLEYCFGINFANFNNSENLNFKLFTTSWYFYWQTPLSKKYGIC